MSFNLMITGSAAFYFIAMAIIHQTDMVVVMFEPQDSEEPKGKHRYFGLVKGRSCLLRCSLSRHPNPCLSGSTEESKQDKRRESHRSGIPDSSTFERSRSLDVTKFVTSQLLSSSTLSNKATGVFGASFTRGTSGNPTVTAGSYAASESSEVRTTSIEGVNVTVGVDDNDQHSKAGTHQLSCYSLTSFFLRFLLFS